MVAVALIIMIMIIMGIYWKCGGYRSNLMDDCHSHERNAKVAGTMLTSST